MERLAVIGGSGFLGRHLIAACPDWDIVSFDRVPFVPESPPRVRTIVADAHDLDALRTACREVDVLWIRAGMLGGGASIAMDKASQYLATNTDLVRDVLRVCDESGIKRVLFDSSEQVWGSSADLERQRADGEPFAGNFYGASKLIAEKILRYWAFSGGGRSVQIFRYSRVRTALTRDVIFHMVSAAIQGNPVRIVGNPAHRISFVHVEDVIEANLAALRSQPPYAVHQISADRPFSLLDLARLVGEVMGREIALQFDSAPVREISFEPLVVGMEWEESACGLGVAPRWTLAAMIQETVEALDSSV